MNSSEEPVAIDNVAAPGGGRIGLVACPGLRLQDLVPGTPPADAVDHDLEQLVAWGATALVTLLQPYEFTLLRVEPLTERVGRFGLAWWHMPVTDGAAPGEDEAGDNQAAKDLRTYGVAAQILVDLGVRRMRVLSAPKKIHALAGFGLEVVEYVLPGEPGA